MKDTKNTCTEITQLVFAETFRDLDARLGDRPVIDLEIGISVVLDPITGQHAEPRSQYRARSADVVLGMA